MNDVSSISLTSHTATRLTITAHLPLKQHVVYCLIWYYHICIRIKVRSGFALGKIWETRGRLFSNHSLHRHVTTLMWNATMLTTSCNIFARGRWVMFTLGFVACLSRLRHPNLLCNNYLLMKYWYGKVIDKVNLIVWVRACKWRYHYLVHEV